MDNISASQLLTGQQLRRGLKGQARIDCSTAGPGLCIWRLPLSGAGSWLTIVEPEELIHWQLDARLLVHSPGNAVHASLCHIHLQEDKNGKDTTHRGTAKSYKERLLLYGICKLLG